VDKVGLELADHAGLFAALRAAGIPEPPEEFLDPTAPGGTQRGAGDRPQKGDCVEKPRFGLWSKIGFVASFGWPDAK
jgi:hypothetical protein